MAWLRVDEDIDTHPQIADAAEDAWLALPVFEAVLRLCKRHGKGGRVEPACVTARHVARRLCFPPSAVPDVDAALEALVAHGALDRDGEVWVVPGWSRYQTDPTAAERMERSRERSRERKNTSPSYGPDRNVTVVTPVTPDSTGHDSTGHDSTGHDGTGQDGTGQDQPPPPPVPGGARPPTVPRVMEMTTEEVFDAVPLDIPPLDAKPARNGAGLAAQVAQVYEHWRSHHPQAAPRLRPKAKEARLIEEALRSGHTVASLSESIDGYHADPWHRGANERGTAYLDLALILRDESHIARGIEMARNPRQGRPVHGPTAGNAAVLAAFVRDEQARAEETRR